MVRDVIHDLSTNPAQIDNFLYEFQAVTVQSNCVIGFRGGAFDSVFVLDDLRLQILSEVHQMFVSFLLIVMVVLELGGQAALDVKNSFLVPFSLLYNCFEQNFTIGVTQH